MPAPTNSPEIPFSAKLTADENALLLKLRAHIEAKEGRTISKTDILRMALTSLATQQKRTGFEP